jgi:hypothetical protein
MRGQGMTIDDVLKKTAANERRLVTGDTLRELPDKQILILHTGERLTIKRGGEWQLDGKNGEIGVLPQAAQELRHPQQYDMSNGAKITFRGGRIEIRYAQDGLVAFDPHGVIYVKRGDILQVVRQFVAPETTPLVMAG